MQLYHIHKGIQDTIYQHTDLETGEMLPGWELAIEELDMARDEKINQLLRYAQSKELEAEACKKEADRKMERAKKAEKKAENLQTFVRHYMQVFGLEKLDTEDFQISIRKSSSVKVLDEAMIPGKFWNEKVTRTIMKNGIKEAIKNGEQVPGAEIMENKNIIIK